MSRLDRVAELEAQLARTELRARTAAKVMYRRGYLAGHSAGRNGATRRRGPNRKTREALGA